MFHEMIARCAESFGPAPREISWWDRLTYWRISRPDWLLEKPEDEMKTLFSNLQELRSSGRVVWGHIIQANQLLFSPGRDNCPGEVVYSLSQSISPNDLGEIAGALASLKHTRPMDPELASIAHYLTNERIRVYGKPVPAAISPRHPCQISTIFFVRKHLPGPGHHLRPPFLPIIVHPHPPHVALVLPARHWPAPLIEWWAGRV